MNQPPPVPKKRGCFFYGCVVSVVLLLVVGTSVFFAVRFGMRKFNEMIATYTATAPQAMPKSDLPPDQLAAVQKRVAEFAEAVNKGRPSQALMLTGGEINALVSHDPALKGLADKLHVTVEGDAVRGKVSLPLQETGIERLKGRYLNGEGTFKVSLQNGVLVVTLHTLEINGQKIPSEFMKQLQAQNLAKDIAKDPKASQVISKIESVEVKDGVVLLKNRAP